MASETRGCSRNEWVARDSHEVAPKARMMAGYWIV